MSDLDRLLLERRVERLLAPPWDRPSSPGRTRNLIFARDGNG
jgi:hypothetical protein